jgi:hypothetical protein
MNLTQLQKEFPNLPVLTPDKLYKGRKTSAPITPMMLVATEAEVISTRLDKQAQWDEAVYDVIVTYDRNYAVRKLVTDLRRVIKDVSLEDWQTFTKEAWEAANKKL